MNSSLQGILNLSTAFKHETSCRKSWAFKGFFYMKGVLLKWKTTIATEKPQVPSSVSGKLNCDKGDFLLTWSSFPQTSSLTRAVPARCCLLRSTLCLSKGTNSGRSVRRTSALEIDGCRLIEAKMSQFTHQWHNLITVLFRSVPQKAFSATCK